MQDVHHGGCNCGAVRLGCLDHAPFGLAPDYEFWTPRREHWLVPVADAAQHEVNRPATA